jgi:hypothetical protein
LSSIRFYKENNFRKKRKIFYFSVSRKTCAK